MAVRQSVSTTVEVAAVLRVLRHKFIDRFGREPRQDDTIFFDLPHPEHVEHLIAKDLRAAGIDSAIIHDFEKPGGSSRLKTSL